MFADDLKIFSQVGDSTACEQFQLDLDAINSWNLQNNLKLNIKKCNAMKFSRSKNDLNFRYTIEDKALQWVTVYKDLGVIMDPQLTFDEYLNYIVNKANMRLGFVTRNTRDFVDVRSHLVLFNALVRSILEYGACIWNPMYLQKIQRIERIQIKFVKYLCYRSGIQCHSQIMNSFLNILDCRN